MLKQIIETIDTKNSWGKNQLLKEIEPCILKEVCTYRSNMDMIRTITIYNALDKFIDYINSKASHGKVELKLALLDLIANSKTAIRKAFNSRHNWKNDNKQIHSFYISKRQIKKHIAIIKENQYLISKG